MSTQHIKTVLEIKYDVVPDAFTDKKKLLQGLIGTQADSQPESPSENIKVEIADQQSSVAIEAKRIFIASEQSDPLKAQQFIAKIYERTDKLLGITHAQQLSCRSIFIDPYDKTFSDLVDLHKKRFLAHNELVDSAYDVGLPLTFEKAGYTVHLMTGPMKKTELTQGYLEFTNEGLSDVLSFLSLAFVKQNLDVSSKFIASCIKESGQIQQSYVEKWKGVIKSNEQ